MSTAPSAKPLFRYVPGKGTFAAIECVNYTATLATAFSTSDQVLVAGTAVNVRHDVAPLTFGISVVTGANGFFWVPATGIYKIIPSVQLLGVGNGIITIWIKVNGVNVPNTSTATAYKTGDESVITCEYILPLNSSDQVQVWCRATTNAVINEIPAGGAGADAYPAAPGVITNMYRIR
jgi:hypothetical protein